MVRYVNILRRRAFFVSAVTNRYLVKALELVAKGDIVTLIDA